MSTDIKQKVKCVCSQYISIEGMKRHLLTKKHTDRLISKKRTEPLPEKIQQYTDNKDSFNCCSKCYRIKIPELYFNLETNVCKACDEIELNQDKLCKYCNITKNITLLERPYLVECKKCAADRAKTKVTCEKCSKVCDYGTFSKHKKLHVAQTSF